MRKVVCRLVRGLQGTYVIAGRIRRCVILSASTRLAVVPWLAGLVVSNRPGTGMVIGR